MVVQQSEAHVAAPLDGVRVIDLTAVMMGPWACQILGDLGADVTKVEAPGGDGTRKVGPARNPGMSAFFLNLNRNKRSIVLDLKAAEARAAVVQLIKDADVLVYNMRPAALKRLGLDYETLAQINPRLIHAGAVGFGQNGPYAGRPAYDDLIQGMAALPSLLPGAPRYLPVSIADRVVALHLVISILAALKEREVSGLGQALEQPMFETMVQFVLGEHLHGATFEPPIGPMGYQRLLAEERRPYQTQDGYICVLVYTDRHWEAFCGLIERPDLWNRDPRFASLTSRTNHVHELYGMVADAMLSASTAEWMERLGRADIPANPVHTLESLLGDTHLAHVGFFGQVEHPTEGLLRTMAVPGRWSRSRPGVRRPAPGLGEHTAEVLTEAGLSADEIAALVTATAER